MKYVILIFIGLVISTAESQGQDNPYGIRLCCPGKVMLSESSSNYTLRTLDVESLGSYDIKWPDDLKNEGYNGTAIMSVNLDSKGEIILIGIFKSLNSELDTIAIDIIDNCKSEFRRIIKERSSDSATSCTYGFLISLNFEKKE